MKQTPRNHRSTGTSVAFAFFIAILLLNAGKATARTITREEALRAAFPNAKVDSVVVFLTDQEKKKAEEISGTEAITSMVARYIASVNGKEVGRAYLDTHVVRTKKESLLVILNLDGTIRRVEVVAFLEPPEYMPPDKWYRQFDGKSAKNNLRVQGEIHSVTGATLTAKATTEAVRRVLAIDGLLEAKRKN